MSTATKLQSILTSKGNIKTAIQAKGVTVGDAPLADYATKITNIPTGGSVQGIVMNDVYNKATNVQVIPYSFTSSWTSVRGLFGGCVAVTNFSQVSFDTSISTNFQYLFQNCAQMVTAPQLNTSNGDKFGHCFQGCQKLTDTPNWDFSNGTDFNNLFRSCNKLENFNTLNTSSGTNFSYMFMYCAFTTAPQLNTSSGTNFTSMFARNPNLVTVPQLNVSSGTDFTQMFYNCSNLENLGGFVGLKAPLILSYSNKITHQSLLNVIDGLADMTGQSQKTLNIGATNLAKLTAEQIAVATAKNWIVS